MAQAKHRKSARSQGKTRPKERGTWLSLALVVMVLHGAFGAYLFYTVRVGEPYLDRPWILTLMVVHFLANILAAAGIWYWKKWGLVVYAASTVLAVVVGLLSIGVWSVFYFVLPMAILGYILRAKWDYFQD
jgi:hypothetical protein